VSSTSLVPARRDNMTAAQSAVRASTFRSAFLPSTAVESIANQRLGGNTASRIFVPVTSPSLPRTWHGTVMAVASEKEQVIEGSLPYRCTVWLAAYALELGNFKWIRQMKRVILSWL
jgi:hypothetical protein